MAKEKIGIIGGTFDPIHQGHIRMAVSAIQEASLDRVLVIPSGNPPHKECYADPESRWHMVVAACSQDTRLQPCRIELDREGPTYTIDTLNALKAEYPKAEFSFIIGIDRLMNLDQWKQVRELFHMCDFLVCPRATDIRPSQFRAQMDRLTAMGARLTMIHMVPVTVSSTDLRDALACGNPTSQLYVSVREYCHCKGLYGMDRRIPEAAEWVSRLFADLTPHRFSHTLSVAHTARRLARLHGLDPDKAETAGLLHDCAKCMPLKDMQLIARTHSLTTDPEVLSSGSLLHSLAGAWVARNTYGMADPEVLQAITFHSTGRAGMNLLDMCIYLADSIEPTRQSYPDLDQIRMLADLSLPKAMLVSLQRTVDYVRSRGKYLHPATLSTLAWLKTNPVIQPSAVMTENR